MTDRLEIASRLLAQCMDPNSYRTTQGPEIRERGAEQSLLWADALMAADSHASTDQAEMARTIQRLEGRIGALRLNISTAADMATESPYVEGFLRRIIDADTEAAK